ncbi:hypothetical protein TSOC_007690 [Tetrabaena socialis]|uniref:PHD-type domain-containing protein n=1 Tax=Tetrabaena socialis TaxID=47790 RepID=A0A2J8A0I8_9CHLO|nr:hypothetical protein TSOC_007690 [Tetrabaena socialis]|eukprot:PNH06026.1 hypothetical protein TSOC_007690 [Tetrabaena socialis]
MQSIAASHFPASGAPPSSSAAFGGCSGAVSDCAVDTAHPPAAGNLLIAQHRDTLRYSAVRTGRYLARPIVHAPATTVRVRASRQRAAVPAAVPAILQVESVGAQGVAVLMGRDGARTRRRVEQLLPCHLPVNPIVDPRLFRLARDLQCEVCGSPHVAARMLLCDGCNTGWHWPCLHLRAQPEGAREALAEQPGAEPSARPDVGRELFPRAGTRRLDEEAAGLHLRRVRLGERAERGREAGRAQEGVLQFRGALARPECFTVR